MKRQKSRGAILGKFFTFLKKVFIFIFIFFILIGGIFGYVKYKLYSVEKAVLEYLINDEHISEEDITAEPFIANLSGEKNWMISIKITDDTKTYSYYKNKDNKIVLESYIDENDELTLLNKVMN